MPEIPNEYFLVEWPFIEQLTGLGWEYLSGDTDVPDFTERESFREVLLTKRLSEALRRLNPDPDGKPWLDEHRIAQAMGRLERLGSVKLMEANQAATELLIIGTTVDGDPARDKGRDQLVKYIDFDHPERNDFLVINQFRVDVPGGQTYIVPDIVLFVNGIPLVVVECKSPAITDPMQEGITQLLRYSNQRDWVEGDEGVERLFHYNQLMISTWFHEARVGTVGASLEHYLEWKDTSPIPMAEVASNLGLAKLTSQQLLVAGMLRKEHLPDIIRNFVLFQQTDGKTIKIVCRYQQFRAVQESIRRLSIGKTRREDGESDKRGGIIWHTQGSGKSLTMVFLVRKMRTMTVLRRFKVVIITDRIDLEKQLSETAALTGETVKKTTSTSKLTKLLSAKGPGLVFATIQKFQEKDDDHEIVPFHKALSTGSPVHPLRRVADGKGVYLIDKGQTQSFTETNPAPTVEPAFPVLNESENILVLVDEAHRSQSSDLHANLLKALPNCARIGFTGTPILIGDRKKTHEIFGSFIDRYTIQQSEADGATVPILYEGRTADGMVSEGGGLDQLFEDMFLERSPEEVEAIKQKYATKGNVLEAEMLIAAKAEDIVTHYVSTVLPNGLKAQVVATSRLAAVRYQKALVKALTNLIAELESLGSNLALAILDVSEIEKQDKRTRFLASAYPQLDTIRQLKAATVISGGNNDEHLWNEWTDKGKIDTRIEAFKKPLFHVDEKKRDPLAFLCVKSMLLTGFDAPVEQVLYLDRAMQGHELLQAIARVNRPYKGKNNGLVVDYYGVGRHLKEALAVYNADDVQGALVSIKDELPKLADRHRRVVNVFHERCISDISDVNACVEVLANPKVRADFVAKLKLFYQSLDIVLPRPEALRFVRDAKTLGFISKVAANLYRDTTQLNLYGVGAKVRKLIDEHIVAKGIDPKIAPISILDADFERAVDAHVSDRSKAAEMEHAARYHISTHYNEDPAYYKKLSERLEEILQEMQANWEELVAALQVFTAQVRQGRPADESGLDPRTQAPFLGILIEEVSGGSKVSPEKMSQLARLTIDMVDHIRQEIAVVDFWRNAYAQDVLRKWLVKYLDESDAVTYSRLRPVADRLVELSKALHTRIIS